MITISGDYYRLCIASCRIASGRLAHGRDGKGVHELTFQHVTLPGTGEQGSDPVVSAYLHTKRSTCALPLHRRYLAVFLVAQTTQRHLRVLQELDTRKKRVHFPTQAGLSSVVPMSA